MLTKICARVEESVRQLMISDSVQAVEPFIYCAFSFGVLYRQVMANLCWRACSVGRSGSFPERSEFNQ